MCDEMASIKYVNEGQIRTPCVCWRLFRKVCLQLDEMVCYNALVGKRIDQLNVEENLFVVRFEIDMLESVYRRLQSFAHRDGVCGCGRKYDLPEFQIICKFQRTLNGIDYMEITT